jgi:hypothetical protein
MMRQRADAIAAPGDVAAAAPTGLLGAARAASAATATAPAATATATLAPAGSLKASSGGLLALVARAVSPRIGAVHSQRIEQETAPTDVPGLTAALGRAQREIVRLKDEVSALLSAAAGRGGRERLAAEDAVEAARRESAAGAAAREAACRALSSLEYGMEQQKRP